MRGGVEREAERDEVKMKDTKDIGLLFYMPRYGGGTFQLTDNVMCALEDYADTHEGTRVHVFFNKRQAEAMTEVGTRFPRFVKHRLGEPARLLSAVLRRFFLAVPWCVPVLRRIYPLTWIARGTGIDVMLFPGITPDASLYSDRQITLFTDIAHIFFPQFPELAAKGELRRRNILFRYCARYADEIVVESKQLRDDTVKYYGAQPSRVSILHQTMSQTLERLGDEREDSEALRFATTLPERYFFYPAQMWEHKNHENLLVGMKHLSRAHPDVHLILVGSRKEGDERIFALINDLGLRERVKWFGYVSDGAIRVLYKNAEALVKPGYIGPTNIPTIEAFYYGCPAVISDLPGVREQTGDAALLFDPDSPEDISRKLRSILEEPRLRETLVSKGRERLKELGYPRYRDTLATILDRHLGVNSSDVS